MSSDLSHTHPGGPRVYALVLAALVALTGITVAASYVNFGAPWVNVVIALSIASIKGSLVALYFMHLRWDKPINAMIFAGGLFFLALLLMLTLIDTETRDVVPYWNSKPPAGGAATK
ncbi:MAG: cytochrome C oxidase subunit IV family protein [Acidobacteria bacterium]|nr:cytochrome C oxidase subunit IV family protein [Acidobacteriota bacterium]